MNSILHERRSQQAVPEHPASHLTPTTFGIEEEFMFLSRDRLIPVACGEEAQNALKPDLSVNRFVGHEFLASQIEYSSPVLSDADEALDAIAGFRMRLAGVADSLGVIAAGTGSPFDTNGRPVPTLDARYEQIRSTIRAVVKDHQMNAVHVHVNVPSPDDGVRALNGVRPWLPALLALSSNSPYWHAQDTGFASWRSLVGRRWPTTGCPPYFRDAVDYELRTAALVKLGAATDKACIAWNARLSDRYPTLEVRVFDAQLDAASTVVLALLSRALVVTTLRKAPRPNIPVELLDAALWKAGRDGLRSTLLDPLSGELVSAGQAIEALVMMVTPALTETGDLDIVREGVRKRLLDGSGADVQRAAFRRGGVSGLGELLTSSLRS